MNRHLRNALAFVAGFVVGSIVNMAIVQLGSIVVPPPGGVDVNSVESISPAMAQGLYEFRHFVPPFLAHAVGTLVAATVTFQLAATAKSALTWGIGALFLLGGIVAATLIPAPGWFVAADLLLAYLPMAWLAMRFRTDGAP